MSKTFVCEAFHACGEQGTESFGSVFGVATPKTEPRKKKYHSWLLLWPLVVLPATLRRSEPHFTAFYFGVAAALLLPFAMRYSSSDHIRVPQSHADDGSLFATVLSIGKTNDRANCPEY